ncbi:hypothetical protein [Anaerocaecibacter muris]|uniref:hypothetical protein n=1 Tax=Anaerocaecibacter muris TaxID=2941513 RepID=UPI003F68CE58
MDDLFDSLRYAMENAVTKQILDTTPRCIQLGTLKVNGALRFDTVDKIRGMRVIFNNPTTILIVNGKKYIAKAHNEEFDEEKGLLMCLAKASGYTHANLKALLKSAQRQVPKK